MASNTPQSLDLSKIQDFLGHYDSPQIHDLSQIHNLSQISEISSIQNNPDKSKLRPVHVRTPSRRLDLTSPPSDSDVDLDLLTPRRTSHKLRLFLVGNPDAKEIEYVTQKSQGLKSKNPIYYHLGQNLDQCRSVLIYIYSNPKLQGQLQVIVSRWEYINGHMVCHQRMAQAPLDNFVEIIEMINLKIRLGHVNSPTIEQILNDLAQKNNWHEIKLTA